MIKNNYQRQIAQRKIASTIDEAQNAGDTADSTWSEFQSDLQAEINEYDLISAGLVQNFMISCIDDLADSLIKARIARRWTQSMLAEKLGVTEQRIQRDESGGYERAEIHRIADTAEALGYELNGELRPIGYKPTEIHQSEWALQPHSIPSVVFNFGHGYENAFNQIILASDQDRYGLTMISGFINSPEPSTSDETSGASSELLAHNHRLSDK